MARPTKLTPEIKQKIGENISLGLTYAFAASAAGITYQTLNQWLQRGQTEKSGKYYLFSQYIQKRNADAAKALLEKLNDAAEAGNCHVCMWILERRFSEDFARRVYRKTNVVTENLNQNVDIGVMDTDKIRGNIIDKLSIVREL
jgi:hypothetical protein